MRTSQEVSEGDISSELKEYQAKTHTKDGTKHGDTKGNVYTTTLSVQRPLFRT